MKSIDDIIHDECLPMGDCMLTVQDERGEAGFFYFKEKELIEANYATLWGKDALAEVLTWSLADYALAPLPLGIKRSLWEPLEALLSPKLSATESGRIPILKARYSRSDVNEEEQLGVFKAYRDIPGVTQLILLQNNQHRVLFQSEKNAPEQTEWLKEFYGRVQAIGETLGFGLLDRWTLYTDHYHMIGLKQEQGLLGIFRRHEVGLDDFEAACQASIDKL